VQMDKELVEAAQQGDVAAFGQLYDRYVDKIYRYLYLHLRRREEAEDLAEEVFLKALKSLKSFRWQGVPFSAWLFRIARNLLIDHYRKGVAPVALDEGAPSSSPDVESMVEDRLSIAQVKEAMRELTEAQQQVIALRFGAELSIAETAQIMSKKEGAIKALQHSAVAALRRLMASSFPELGQISTRLTDNEQTPGLL